MKITAYLLTLFAASALASQAGVITLTFEGLRDEEEILNYYNGGYGSLGSGPGPNYGIIFSPNSEAIIEDDKGGRGDFRGEPSPDTIVGFLYGVDIMDVPAGFTTGFSFYYSAVFDPGTVNVWSGLDATGTLLASISLPLTPDGANECGASLCSFVADGEAFSGTALSVDFGPTADEIGFDNITLGSSVPTQTIIPEPSTLMMLAGGVLAIFGGRRFRKP